jgi:hypothetical protein
MKFFCLIQLFFLMPICVNTQTLPVESERLRMNLVYQLGFVPIPAGELIFQLYKCTKANSPVICLEMTGFNLSSYDCFYKYRSYQQTFLDIKTLELLSSERRVNQNGAIFEENYCFNPNTRKATNTSRKGCVTKVQDTVMGNVRVNDFLSTSYNIRNINFSKFKKGQSVSYSIILENKLYPINVMFLGRESIKLQGTVYNCYKLSIQVIEGSVFRAGDAISAWITDDNKRIPVQFEANVLVGSIKAYLASVN